MPSHVHMHINSTIITSLFFVFPLIFYVTFRLASLLCLFAPALFFLLFVPPLQNMFAVHGDLAHVKVVYDRSTGKSMGYGFVKFTTNEAAAAATAAINGMAIERKRIKVRR